MPGAASGGKDMGGGEPAGVAVPDHADLRRGLSGRGWQRIDAGGLKAGCGPCRLTDDLAVGAWPFSYFRPVMPA